MSSRIGSFLAFGVLLAGAALPYHKALAHHNMTALFDLNERRCTIGAKGIPIVHRPG